jgi:ABC-type multidrug transport system permease subunit
MNQIRAMYASAVQQWKNISLSGGNLALHLASTPMAAVITWIAMQRGDPAALSYLLVGLPLMTVWSGVVFRIGYTLQTEMNNQVLQFVYISRTPLILVSLGKAAAQIIWGLPTGLVSLVVVYFMTKMVPQVADVGSLLISLILVIIGIVVASLFFSPLMVLVGGPTGFFGVIILLGSLLGGFVFPVDRLPLALAVLARLVPTSWAMDAVSLSIRGTDNSSAIPGLWGMSILAAVVLFGITYLMFKAIEKKLRVEGIRDVY